MTKEYDPRQIQQVLDWLGFIPTINDDYGVSYFIKDQKYLWSLNVWDKQGLDKLRVEEKCRIAGIPFQQFDALYRKAKKHKKLES